MGFIREPKGVDFFVINKPFTVAEKKEFSLLIQSIKKKKVQAKRIRTHKKRKVTV
jgi:hypothetical protein